MVHTFEERLPQSTETVEQWCSECHTLYDCTPPGPTPVHACDVVHENTSGPIQTTAQSSNHSCYVYKMHTTFIIGLGAYIIIRYFIQLIPIEYKASKKGLTSTSKGCAHTGWSVVYGWYQEQLTFSCWYYHTYQVHIEVLSSGVQRSQIAKEIENILLKINDKMRVKVEHFQKLVAHDNSCLGLEEVYLV